MRNRSSIARRMTTARVVCVPLDVTNSLKEPPRTTHFQRGLTENSHTPHGIQENQCTTC
jgi:hypothetical protein